MRHQALTATLAAGLIAVGSLVPAAALANGAASTRNIILGGAAAAAATLMIINHNKKVHQHYAQDAQNQAALAAQRNDLAAALAQERRAYANEVAVNEQYQREVSVQHREVVALRSQLAKSHASQPGFVRPVAVRTHGGPPQTQVSYGWGTL